MSRRATGHRRALATFEAHLVRLNRAPRSIELLLGTARQFLAGLDVPVARVRPEHVRAFLAVRHEAGVAGPTQAHELSRLRGFFRALIEAGLARTDPTEGLTVRHGGAAPRLVLGADQAKRVLQVAAEVPADAGLRARALAARDAAALEILYAVGSRVSEVCAARVTDLDLVEGALLVRRVKRGTSRALPLPQAALAPLRRYLVEARPYLVGRQPEDHGLLLVTRSGRPLRRDEAWALVVRVARRAGLRGHPHAIRRALASDLARAGVNVVAIQELLGHRRLGTTSLYLAVDPGDLRRAVDTLEW